MTIRTRSSALQREVLVSVLKEEASDPGACSIAAHALYGACEFWAAVNNGTLRHYLGARAAVRLRFAAIVYTAMGATRVANSIYEALAELPDTATTVQCEQCAVLLQRRLRGSVDPLHDLIARLAHRVH
jgi:hypothetical protein